MKDRNTTKRERERIEKLYPKEDTVTRTHTHASVKECLERFLVQCYREQRDLDVHPHTRRAQTLPRENCIPKKIKQHTHTPMKECLERFLV
jgi:hypothetical protein